MRSLLAREVRYADAGIQRCIEQRTTPGQPNVRSVVPLVKRLTAIDALLAGDGLWTTAVCLTPSRAA